MKLDTKQHRLSRRRFLKDCTLVVGAIQSSSVLAEIAHPSPMKAVVVGDSAMWGQGLRERQKFSRLSVQEIGQLLGREASIEVNLSHSGAAIRLGSPDCSPKCMRRQFADTYPTLFQSTHTKRRLNDFIENNVQDRAVLFGEIPSAFPTISYQIEKIDQTTGQSIELVLMNGGVNDIDFEDYLTPTEHRDNFIQYFDPLLEEYFYKRARSLIRQAREKFPVAVLIYTGYVSPFAPGHSDAQVRNLFEHLQGAADWKVYINKHPVKDTFKKVDQLVLEAQHRSQFGLTRSLYWLRKAIAEANADSRLRGPGILFVHPGFTEKNTVFEVDSLFHPYYKIPEIKDPSSKAIKA